MSTHDAADDTGPEARRVHAHLTARLSPADRARRVRDLTVAAASLALAGLRRRHPEADERELLLRLAVLRLGADVVEQAYGWRGPDDEP